MIHHLALTASNLQRSLSFYDAVLEPLGYKRKLTFSELATWEGPEPEILIYQARPGQIANTHLTYDPGVHHVAFFAASREIIDRIGIIAPQAGGTILDRPREDPDYSPGYYAVFFNDPDGIKIEIMTKLPEKH